MPNSTPVNSGSNYLDFEIGSGHPPRETTPTPGRWCSAGRSQAISAFPVSVGVLGQPAIASDVKLVVDRVPTNWFLLWLAIFGALLGLFFYCIRKTTILRDPVVDPSNPETMGTYSLARTQAAWWFFFILASYLLIGIVTGDFFTSLNGTALTLLGIGAGTAVLGSAIDATGAAKDASDRTLALASKRQELADLEAAIRQQNASRATAEAELAQLNAANSVDAAAVAAKTTELSGIRSDLAAKAVKKAAIESQIKKLTGRCENSSAASSPTRTARASRASR